MDSRRLIQVAYALLIVASSANHLFAASIPWQTDLKQAAREAARTKKPMLIRVTASWCGPCKKMKATTFKDAEIAARINGCFVPVSVDHDTNPQFVKTVEANVLPMTLIISPDLKVIKRIKGFHTAAQLKSELDGLCPSTPTSTTDSRVQIAASRNLPASRSIAGRAPSFGGYCLVSMLDDRKLRRGDARFATSYRGHIVRFTNDVARQRFLAAPTRYWPMLDGNCPVSKNSNGRRPAGTPRVPVIYRNRLWFFADRAARRTFASKPASYLSLAK